MMLLSSYLANVVVSMHFITVSKEERRRSEGGGTTATGLNLNAGFGIPQGHSRGGVRHEDTNALKVMQMEKTSKQFQPDWDTTLWPVIPHADDKAKAGAGGGGAGTGAGGGGGGGGSKMTLGGLTMLDIATGMTRWTTDGISNVPTAHINMAGLKAKLRLALIKTKKAKQRDERMKR